MAVHQYQQGILPGGADKVLPPEWVFFAPLESGLAATGKGDTTPTFTRASVATYKNGANELVGVASGVPRFAARGLLIEGARTNLATYSEQLDNGSTTGGPWWRTSCTVLANVAPSPYIGAPVIADRVLEWSANAWHVVHHAYTGGANQKDALSVKASVAGRDWCHLDWWDSAGGFVVQYFNVATGTVGSKSESGGPTILTAEMEPYALGYWRLKIVVQTAANTSRAIEFGPAQSDGVGSYPGTAEVLGTNFIAPGVELNVPFVSSYIPTVASSVTRQQDKLSYPASNVPVDDGTISAEFTKYYLGVGAQGSIVETVSAIEREGVRLWFRDNGRRVATVWTTGPVPQAEIDSVPDSYVPHVPSVVWVGYRTNWVRLFVNGKGYGTDLAAAMPSVQNRISIGMSGADTNPLFGWVRNVYMWENTRVP